MQPVQRATLTPDDVDRAFHRLVLDPETVARVGTSMVSGTSMFLYGPPGTGKTTIATSIPGTYNDSVWIPHAIEVDNQIITVYDPGAHKISSDPIPEESDKRWVLCSRPCVLAGGRLSPETPAIQFHTSTRFYTAPLHLKANNVRTILATFVKHPIPTD